MVKDIPLARALHAACELGEEIPADLYTAVARVLAFVMALKARGAAAGMHPMQHGRRRMTRHMNLPRHQNFGSHRL